MSYFCGRSFIFFMSSIRDFAQIDLIVNDKEAVAELDRTRKKVQA